jgi:DNA (cytosine-5)-methyltransferase 1
MKYATVCSGIEAPSVAWDPLNWEPVFFSEIEPFPIAVLKHHYPTVPNLGDMTKLAENQIFNEKSIDLICGGTPCQSFSIAGLRKGLDDPRGNLMLTYLQLVDIKKPKWVIRENVPGVLSSNGGRDFGTFLGALGKLGYGFAYRVLDAQYFGVAQRRRRVFVVAYLGDWRPAAAVLFESHSLCRNTSPIGEKRKGDTRTFKNNIGKHSQWWDGGQTAATITTRSSDQYMPDKNNFQAVIVNNYINSISNDCSVAVDLYNQTIDGQVAATLTQACGGTNTSGPKVLSNFGKRSFGVYKETDKAETLRSSGGDLGGGSETFSVCEKITDIDSVAKCITASEENRNMITHAFKIRGGCDGGGKGYLGQDECAFTISTSQDQQIAVKSSNYVVRRLTPKECERLQGFPDDWTKIPYKNKPMDNCPDGPRYKAIGNSMAVPVVRWIGQRIEMVEKIINSQ